MLSGDVLLITIQESINVNQSLTESPVTIEATLQRITHGSLLMLLIIV
jgi:hypothetical protein